MSHIIVRAASQRVKTLLKIEGARCTEFSFSAVRHTLPPPPPSHSSSRHCCIACVCVCVCILSVAVHWVFRLYIACKVFAAAAAAVEMDRRMARMTPPIFTLRSSLSRPPLSCIRIRGSAPPGFKDPLSLKLLTKIVFLFHFFGPKKPKHSLFTAYVVHALIYVVVRVLRL